MVINKLYKQISQQKIWEFDWNTFSSFQNLKNSEMWPIKRKMGSIYKCSSVQHAKK